MEPTSVTPAQAKASTTRGPGQRHFSLTSTVVPVRIAAEAISVRWSSESALSCSPILGSRENEVGELGAGDLPHRAHRGRDEDVEGVLRVQAPVDLLPGPLRAPRAVGAGEPVVGDEHAVHPAGADDEVAGDVQSPRRVEDRGLDAGEHSRPSMRGRAATSARNSGT